MHVGVVGFAVEYLSQHFACKRHRIVVGYLHSFEHRKHLTVWCVLLNGHRDFVHLAGAQHVRADACVFIRRRAQRYKQMDRDAQIADARAVVQARALYDTHGYAALVSLCHVSTALQMSGVVSDGIVEIASRCDTTRDVAELIMARVQQEWRHQQINTARRALEDALCLHTIEEMRNWPEVIAFAGARTNEKICARAMERVEIECGVDLHTAATILAALMQLGIAVAFLQTLFTGVIVALSLAFGLAFGLGGQSAAARYLERMQAEMHDRQM